MTSTNSFVSSHQTKKSTRKIHFKTHTFQSPLLTLNLLQQSHAQQFRRAYNRRHLSSSAPSCSFSLPSVLTANQTTMAPLVESFPPSQLPHEILSNAKGGYRKGFNGDLRACELMEMMQYVCEVEQPVTRESKTRCWPVERLFRR